MKCITEITESACICILYLVCLIIFGNKTQNMYLNLYVIPKCVFEHNPGSYTGEVTVGSQSVSQLPVLRNWVNNDFLFEQKLDSV